MKTLIKASVVTVVFAGVLAGGAVVRSGAGEAPALRFETADRGDPERRAPVIEPWKRVTLDPEYGGLWVVTGDLDNDGEIELVSARNVNRNDVHYTCSVVAQRLDGTVMWRWGNPTIGRREWHHDVACQIYDWDGDSWNEVIICTKGYLVELAGATGEERRRIPIPDEATDCLVFCNVSGRPTASDVLVKTRYGAIWAYGYGGDPLWTVENPGGHRTAHQPRPYDLDGDGRDEIMAGYAMLNSDGSVRWTVSSEKTDLKKGHLDCCRMVRKGGTPGDFRFALTYCGANAVAYIDGNGKTLWEITGHHFESINIGRLFPDVPGLQILVDIDHMPRGESPVWVIDETGRHLGTIVSDYSRHHKLLDWTGDGLDEIIIAHSLGVFDNRGKRIATFGCDDNGVAVQVGDMTGDGVMDVGITTRTSFYIFKNWKGKKATGKPLSGSGVNYTLY